MTIAARRLAAAAFLAIAAAPLLSGAVAAQTPPPVSASGGEQSLRALGVAPELPVFSAIGKLNRGGEGFCTAVLVSPVHALTAGHCAQYPRTGADIPPERLHFLAGYRRGAYEAHRRAVEVELHPEFGRAQPGELNALRSDLALVTLDAPVADVSPLRIAPALAPGLPLSAAFYSRRRPELPSLSNRCGGHAAGRGGYGDVLALACSDAAAAFFGPGASGGAALIDAGAGVELAAILVADLATRDDARLAAAARPPLAWVERIERAAAGRLLR